MRSVTKTLAYPHPGSGEGNRLQIDGTYQNITCGDWLNSRFVLRTNKHADSLDNRSPSHSFPPARHPRQHRSADERSESEEQERSIRLCLMTPALKIDETPIMVFEQAAIDKRIATRERQGCAHVDAERDGHRLEQNPFSPAQIKCGAGGKKERVIE